MTGIVMVQAVADATKMQNISHARWTRLYSRRRARR
jgi:hypothetical protein